MPLRTSATIDSVEAPPVGLTKQWIAQRTFPIDKPLIDVSQAAPGYGPAPELRQFISELALHDETSTYASSLGLIATRAAVERKFARDFGCSTASFAERVMITAGCNQAFCLAIGALCEVGDDVVVPTPYYFNHAMWLKANGIGCTEVGCQPSAGMLPTLDDIARAIGPRTKAIVAITPNNPCGVSYPPQLVMSLFELAQARGLALILDETYQDFRTTTTPPHRLFSDPQWPDTLVHLSSFSKVFSIPGYRCGTLTAAPHILRAAMKLADCETIGAPRISQQAVAYALDHCDEWVAARRLDMLERVVQFERVVNGATLGYRVLSTGAFFAWVRHPFDGIHSVAVAKYLADQHNVLTIPGEAFGIDYNDCLRLAFGNIDVDTIPELVVRLGESEASGRLSPTG